jgi:hypothetical protein
VPEIVSGNGYEPPERAGALTSDTSFASTGLPQTPQTPGPSADGPG